MSATYTKLKSGDWGIRVVGEPPSEGEQVKVKKKDGSEKTETVDKVIWSDPNGGTHLCSVKQKERAGGYVCAECGRGGALVADLEDGLMKHYRCCDIPPN